MSLSVNEAILKWLSSCFDLGNQLKNDSDCSDGVTPAKILNRIDRRHFNQQWLQTIKSNNDHLRVSNVKKLLLAIKEYNQDILG